MKKLLFLFFAAGVLASCSNQEESNVEVKEVTMNADTKASIISWRGEENAQHFHTGTIALKEGHLSMKGDSVVGGHFVIDMNSINAATEGYPAEKMAKLNAHLRDSSIFNVAKFPETVVHVNSYKDGQLDAEFTVMGIKFNQVVPVKITNSDKGATITGDIKLNISPIKMPYALEINPETNQPALNPELQFNLNIVLN